MSHGLRYAVNCSILFTELPLLERPAAARQAGFEAVEFWWPFAEAVPDDQAADAFVTAILDAGVQLIGLNFFAGDMPAGDRGLVSWPKRSGEFRDNVDATLGLGDRLGCRAFNALYGNRDENSTAAEQDELATENLALAAQAAARIGGTILVEPVSGADRYPLRTAADVITVLDRVQDAYGAQPSSPGSSPTSAGPGHTTSNIGLLADLYHLAVNGDDVDQVITQYGDRVAHVQIADAPGRNEPGTGTLPLQKQLAALATRGYDGWVSLEYKPATTTIESFGWLRPAFEENQS